MSDSDIWKADTSHVSEFEYRAALRGNPKAWTGTVTLTRTIEVQVVCSISKGSDFGLGYHVETNGRRAHGLRIKGGYGYTRLDCLEVEDAMLKARNKRAYEACQKFRNLHKETWENLDSAPAIESNGDGVYKTPCLVCDGMFLGSELDYLQAKIKIKDDDETYDHTVRGLVCSTCDTDEYLKEVIQDVGYLKEENNDEGGE